MSESKAPAPKPAAKEDLLFVTDPSTEPAQQVTTLNAQGQPVTSTTGGFRIHEQLVDGEIRQFKFEHGKPTKMARAPAMKFLSKGFIVKDASGKAIKPLLTEPDGLVGKKPEFKLMFNQTIAELEELNIEALLKRVYQLPNGDRFGPDSSPADMVAFIVHSKAKLAKANAGPDEAKRDAREVGGVPMTPAERVAFFGEE